MPRLIIEYPEGMPDHTALAYAKMAVEQGRVSESRGIAHYCWAIVLGNGVGIYTRRKANERSADSIIILDKS